MNHVPLEVKANKKRIMAIAQPNSTPRLKSEPDVSGAAASPCTAVIERIIIEFSILSYSGVTLFFVA
jgi:hypothetical protein